MDSTPNYTNILSLRLSEVLDDIGINEGMVKKRRQTNMLRETMDNIGNALLGNNMSIYHLGSQTEVTTTKGLQSDFDILICQHQYNVIQDLSEWKPGKSNLLMVTDETCTPGYCFLQWMRSDKPLPVTDLSDKHCIRDRKGRILFKNTLLNDTKARGGGRQGPSYAVPGGGNQYADRDLVTAYPCISWPHSAAGWLDRLKPREWPTPEIKDYAVSSGCLVVGVGSKASANGELEWRISTCLAERCLMFNLNITQIRCYVLMKMILKTFLKLQGEQSLSSFMCKTIMLYCIENTEAHTWKEHNLYTCVKNCLQELQRCVHRGSCPHYIMPENNLMAGQFSAKVAKQLLERIHDFIQSDGRALQRISIDDFGQRLQIKLTPAPQLGNMLHSSAEISKECSGLLHLNLAMSICSVHKSILLKMDNYTETTKDQVHKMMDFQRYGTRLEQVACRFLAPLFYTTIGTSLASASLGQTNTVSPDTMVWISAGLHSDIASSKLKQASVFYSIGDMEKTEILLQQTERQYNNQRAVLPVCRTQHVPVLTPDFNRISHEKGQRCFKEITSFCVILLRCEMNCSPQELHYEMYRSTQTDFLLRNPQEDYWMDWAEVDSLPYLYFLQYKTYGHLQRTRQQQQAFSNLVRSNDPGKDLGHRETVCNLIGQCMEQENRPQDALQYYRLSLQQRSQNNAAKIHICRLLNSLINK